MQAPNDHGKRPVQGRARARAARLRVGASIQVPEFRTDNHSV